MFWTHVMCVKKSKITYLRCIFVSTFVVSLFLATSFCRKVVFCRTIVSGHYFLSQSSFAGPLFLVIIFWPQRRRNWSRPQNVSKLSLLKKKHVFESNNHPGVIFSHVLIGRESCGWEVRTTNQIAPPGMDAALYWQKIRTHGFDWLS